MLTRLDTFLIKAGVIVGSGGLIFGYNVGIISGIMFELTDEFHLGDLEKGLIVSLLSIGSLCGCLLAGYLSDNAGRWRTIQLQDLIYILGSLILTFSVNVYSLYIGRFILGIASAFSAVANVPYLNEIAPPAVRGRLSSMFELMIVLGALLGSVSSLILSNTKYGWRIMFFLPSVVAVVQAVGMLALPESPKWLVQNDRIEEAKNALNSMFGDDEAAAQQVLDSFIEMDSGDSRHQVERSSGVSLQHKPHETATHEVVEYRLAFIVIFILMGLGQLTGSVVVRNYAPTIFSDAGFHRDAALLFNTIISLVNFGVVCMASWYVDRFGRRILLCIGFSITALGMLVLSLGFLGTNPHSTSDSDIAVFLCGCILTSAGFNMGFGPIGWILSSELFPTVIRGRAISVSTLARNSFEFGTNFLFLTMVKTLADSGTFFVFFVFCLLSIVFVVFGLVETKQIEPDEIVGSLAAAPLWRMCFKKTRSSVSEQRHSLNSPIYNPVSSFD